MEMPTHIVAVGGLVTDGGGKVLLVKSERRGWEFPGGQVEVGESLPHAVIREIREESGVSAEVVGIVGIYSNTSKRPGWNGVREIPTIVNVDFRCRYLSGELTLSDETVDFGWFSREEAVKLVSYPKYILRLQKMLDDDGIFHCYAYRHKGEGIDLFETYDFPFTAHR